MSWVSTSEGWPTRVNGEKCTPVQVWDGKEVRVEYYDHCLANAGGCYIPWRGFESNTAQDLDDIIAWAPLLDPPNLIVNCTEWDN